jgi:hypothetical protein
MEVQHRLGTAASIGIRGPRGGALNGLKSCIPEVSMGGESNALFPVEKAKRKFLEIS